jgi:type II secretory pathway pseudopilin PulG
MKFTTKPTSAPPRGVDAFTLAEVLAALVFMAIVIPVALQGLQIASRAGTVAERKREAARVAERVLNESIVATNYTQAVSSGTVLEAEREYRWTLRSEAWTESAMQLLSVEVTFPVQGQDYTVPMSTLVSSQ